MGMGVGPCGLWGWGRKDEPAKEAEQQPAPSTASSEPMGGAVASAKVKPAEAIEVKGSYDAKMAAVRTPDDAPKFNDIEQGALGPGEITLQLPAGDGPVTGSITGALGTQTFSGFVEEGRVSGTFRPDAGSAPRMWGWVLAEVSGEGDTRAVTGTLRASSENGRIVRESPFALKKK